MKVKILSEDSVWKLEEAVNTFLKAARVDQILDIKYSGPGNHAPYSVDTWSAMIIMR